jgi:peptidoglycan lytic transglycosylase B
MLKFNFVLNDSNHHLAIHQPAMLHKTKRWFIRLSILVITSLAFTNSGYANNSDFELCVSKLQSQARNQGISTETVEQVFAKAKHIPRIIELDRRQPEFTQTFAHYFNVRVSDQRIQRGRELLNEHQALLDRIQQETGVSAKYLVSFWGLETNYGGYFGDWTVPESLTTLACDPRRSDFFTQELFNAMRILDAGDISPERMIGSWAGAMGHMQFMPSTFLRYARDADGDGRRDLWGSIPDAMVSAANFLQQLGWVRGLDWGLEVLVPDDFDYSLAGRNKTLSLEEWTKLGIKTVSETNLYPEHQLSLLVPAGYQGPAFLVTKNFHIIMRWNRSEFYALSVGHLADRIAGAPALQRHASSDDARISREQVSQLQRDLSALGIDAGPADGIMGSKTRQAISQFQQNTQLIADGHLNTVLLAIIREAVINQNKP